MPCVFFFFSLKECRFWAQAIISGDLRPSGGSSEMEKSTAACTWNWCSLNLKGHVMFSGNWLNGFGFYNIRSGRFHSAHVYWGMCLPVVFTLTLLPCHTDEPGTKPTSCIAVCSTLPLPFLPSNIVTLGCRWRIWCLHFPSLPVPLLQCRCAAAPWLHTLEEHEGAVGLPGLWLPGFAVGKLGRRGKTGSGLHTRAGGFTISSRCSCRRCWPRAGQGWDGLHTEQGLKGWRQHFPPSW